MLNYQRVLIWFPLMSYWFPIGLKARISNFFEFIRMCHSLYVIVAIGHQSITSFFLGISIPMMWLRWMTRTQKNLPFVDPGKHMAQHHAIMPPGGCIFMTWFPASASKNAKAIQAWPKYRSGQGDPWVTQNLWQPGLPEATLPRYGNEAEAMGWKMWLNGPPVVK